MVLHVSPWCNRSLVYWDWKSIHWATIDRWAYLNHQSYSRIIFLMFIKNARILNFCDLCNYLTGQSMEVPATYTTGNIFFAFLFIQLVFSLQVIYYKLSILTAIHFDSFQSPALKSWIHPSFCFVIGSFMLELQCSKCNNRSGLQKIILS
jgi:hypothetical protein